MRVANFVTHNGDFDFYKVNDRHAPLQSIQDWLVEATGFPVPAPVDSAAIAGLIDIIRCAGCFALSIRYVHLLDMPNSRISTTGRKLPSYMEYDRLSKIFESALLEYCKSKKGLCLRSIAKKRTLRHELAERIEAKIKSSYSIDQSPFSAYSEMDRREFILMENSDDDDSAITIDDAADVEQPARPASTAPRNTPSLRKFCQKSVDAFFDNDLDRTTRLFMKSAVGSFGIMVTSSLDAHRQICIAARGQPMSIAF